MSTRLNKSLEISRAAEKGLIGCALLGAVDECIAAGVCEDYFAHDDNKKIWQTIEELTNEQLPCDTITVNDRLSASNGRRVTALHLTECEDSAPTSSNLGYWLPVVKKNALRRLYRAKVSRLTKALEDPSLEPDELTAAFEAEILDSKAVDDKAATRKEDIRRLVQQIEDVQLNGKILGYPSGYSDLDRHLNGLEKGKMYVIAGRPGAGKTSMAQCLARNQVKNMVSTLIFSCEMTTDQLNLRMLSTESGVNSRDLLTPKALTPSQFKPITSAAAELLRWPIHIRDESDLTVAQVRAEARRMKRLHGIQVVMVDYLQLLQPDSRGEKRYEDVGNISGGLKNMAKELDVPVVALAQLNRETERANRAPRASDLRESGKIEADADAIILLWEPEPNNRPRMDWSLVEAVIAKNRHGSTGTVNFLFKQDATLFEAISPILDEDIPR